MKIIGNHRSAIIIVILLSVTGMLKAQSVTMGPIPGTSFCAGDSITVTFNATGSFGHKNAFTLQLSDVLGSFQTKFSNIGSAKDSLSGVHTLTALIPPDIQSSKAYRFRIMSAVPFTVSPDNGIDITINSKPILSGLGSNPIMPFVGDSVILTVSGSGNTFTWDFGVDAIPSTARGSSTQSVVFISGGNKTIKVVETSLTGCSTSASFNLAVFTCMPAVPKSAIVIDKDGDFGDGGAILWVNPGVTVSIGGGDEIVFAEPGSTISSGGGGSLFYLKAGAVCNDCGGGTVIYADGASISSGTSSAHKCSTLDFDYTNAPPNAAHPLGVKKNLISSVISLSPNPTTGGVSIKGLPSNDLNISVMNLLGETVMELKNLDSPEFTLDLSKLVPGTYYIRFSSANLVVTKKIIKN